LNYTKRRSKVKITKELLETMIREQVTEADIIDFAAEKARRAEFDAMDALRAKLEDPNLSRFQRRAYQATLDTLEAEAAEEEEMRDKEERRKGLHTQLVSKPEAERDVEDLMGASFEDSIARMKARLEKEEDPRKRKDLERMIAAQERNLAMLRKENAGKNSAQVSEGAAYHQAVEEMAEKLANSAATAVVGAATQGMEDGDWVDLQPGDIQLFIEDIKDAVKPIIKRYL
jgi:hypothetical protein